MKNDLTDIPVSYEEIKQYEPMIHKFIREEVLRYWGPQAGYGNNIIPRLGMSVEDLMQYGRMVVCEQIRWFKKHGDVHKAKLTTTIFTRLRNKMISISTAFCTNKRGGNVIDVPENRLALQHLIDTFDFKLSLRENRKLLDEAIKDFTPLKTRFNKKFKSNGALFKFLNRVVRGVAVTSFVDLDSVEGVLVSQSSPNPEEYVLIKEQLSQIMAKGIPYRRRNTSGFTPKLLIIAKERGIESKRDIAALLKITQSSLMKILYGQISGTSSVRSRMEQTFGKSFRELTSLVPVK